MNKFLILIGFAIILGACSRTVPNASDLGAFPSTFPEINETTIPYNIAPLNFRIDTLCSKMVVEVRGKDFQFRQMSRSNKMQFSTRKWSKLLEKSKGDSIYIQVFTKFEGRWSKHRTMGLFVAPEPIDDYLVYRLVMPGYQTWNNMGIYQRRLSTFEQTTIMNNRMLPGTCMNCHSMAQNNPENMVIHLRENNAGTILKQGDKLKKINTNSDKTFGPVAFPSWHPSQRFIAFSVNKVRQVFPGSGQVRAHAIDLNSDVVIYDVIRNELFSSDVLKAPGAFETFPCFSPDGKRLFFVSAPAVEMPQEAQQVKYSLCAVPFDVQTGRVGFEVDTLISALRTGKSVSIPKISPDGRFLMYTRSDYGSFPAYNPETDLYMYDLQRHRTYPLSALNSTDVESYHSWSSNGRWVVFSSRRMDGLFMNCYIAYIDKNGQARKPFLLPQEDPDFHKKFLYSFNIPELSIQKVDIDRFDFENVAKQTSNPGLRLEHYSH